MSSASVFSGVTNKEIVEYYFSSTEAEKIFGCRCKNRIKQNTKAGFGNLMQHVRNMHQDYTSVIRRHVQSQFQNFVPNNKTQNIYSSLDWVICEPRFVPCTSNVAERLFSQVRHVFTDYRKSMQPHHLENQIFLAVNRDFWNAQIVAKLM